MVPKFQHDWHDDDDAPGSFTHRVLAPSDPVRDGSRQCMLVRRLSKRQHLGTSVPPILLLSSPSLGKILRRRTSCLSHCQPEEKNVRKLKALRVCAESNTYLGKISTHFCYSSYVCVYAESIDRTLKRRAVCRTGWFWEMRAAQSAVFASKPDAFLLLFCQIRSEKRGGMQVPAKN